jgi:hypothetical protein
MTRRVRFLVGLALVCGLVACRSTAAPTATLTPAPEPTQTRVVPTATPAQEAPKPTATSDTESASDSESGPPWQIPEVRESDWTKGPDDAPLVIVEYSDFQ